MPRVVASFLSRDQEFQVLQAEDARRAALRHGLELEVLFADNNAIEQIQQLFRFIYLAQAERPSAIVVETVTGEGLERVARNAAQAGIGWVLLNRRVAYIEDLRPFPEPAHLFGGHRPGRGGSPSGATVPHAAAHAWLGALHPGSTGHLGGPGAALGDAEKVGERPRGEGRVGPMDRGERREGGAVVPAAQDQRAVSRPGGGLPERRHGYGGTEGGGGPLR